MQITIHWSGADLCPCPVPSCRHGAGMHRDKGTEREMPPTLPTARPRSTLTSSTPVPCMAQQEERLKRERDRRYTWGGFLFLKSTMHSAELRVSLAKGDERQGSGRTKSNSQLFHVCSSDGTGQKRQPAILIQAGQIATEVRDSLTRAPLLPSSPSTSAKLFHKDRRVIF